jgi:C1A family cysteine protease/glucan-binding YG repeat protein
MKKGKAKQNKEKKAGQKAFHKSTFKKGYIRKAGACLLALSLLTQCFFSGTITYAKNTSDQAKEQTSEGLAETTTTDLDIEDAEEEYDIYMPEEGGYISTEMEEEVPAVSDATETELLEEMGAEDVLTRSSYMTEDAREDLLESSAQSYAVLAASTEGEESGDATDSDDTEPVAEEKEEPAALLSASISSWISRYPTIRSQGRYNTCWAFAVTAMAEIGMINAGLTNSSVDYSEMALAYQTYHTKSDPLGGISDDTVTSSLEDTYLQLGGNAGWTLQTLAQWAGMQEESTYPYGDTSAVSSLGTIDYSQNAAFLQSYSEVNIKENADLVKGYLESGASVFLPVYATTSSISKFYNAETGGYYSYTESSTSSLNQNHAVAIVGYDDTYSKENFVTQPEGDGAWLVRNSWGGSSDGESTSYYGYFWISYYDQGISGAAYVAEFGSQPYDNNYQYDGGVHSSAYRSTKLLAANVFEASASEVEELKAVSIDLSSAETEYCIEIYLNPTDEENPTSGELVSSTSGITGAAGMTVISLDESVYLENGDKYAVVAILTKDEDLDVEGEGAILRIEHDEYAMNSSGYSLYSDVTASEGQSFLKSGGKWVDMASGTERRTGNFRIKAYTDNCETVSGFRTRNKKTAYYQKGKIDTTKNGLYYDSSSGNWYWLVNGVVDKSYSNLVDYNGAWFYVHNGKIDWKYTTLSQVNNKGTWYYVKNGQIDWSYTGLYQYNGTWYYIEKGRLNWSYSNLVTYNGSWFYVHNGKIDWKYTTLSQVNNKGTWYYVKNGQIDWSYTGLYQYYGTWYYIDKGKLNWSYNNLVNYKGGWYYVRNGRIDWSYSNLVKYYGTWYYVQNGKINWSCRTLARVNNKGSWYYVNNGKIDWSYSGYAKYNGKYYRVVKGVVKL